MQFRAEVARAEGGAEPALDAADRSTGYLGRTGRPASPRDIQWFCYGRNVTTVERILEVIAPHRLSYTVIDGLPVKNYLAKIELTELRPGETRIEWSASWDWSLIGLLIRWRLQKVYVEIVAGLLEAATKTEILSAPGSPRGKK